MSPKSTTKKPAAKKAATAKLQVKESLQPQVMPHGNDTTQAFLREVDEALHQEKLLNFWRTYRLPLIGGVALLLITVAGWQAFQGMQNNHSRAVAKDWYTYTKMSVDSSPAKDALRTKIEDEGSTGYRALALIAEAEAAADAKTADAAYAKIYNDHNQPQWVQDLARLNAGMRLMSTDATAAQAHFDKLVTYADPREATAAAAVALEQLALVSLAKGDAASAKGYTQKLLQIPYLTADMRQRAEKRLGAL